jgi:hypothetical protein
LSATIWHVLVGAEDDDGVREGLLDGTFDGCSVNVGLKEGVFDNVGLVEEDGINDMLGDEVGEMSSHMGTSHISHSQVPLKS